MKILLKNQKLILITTISVLISIISIIPLKLAIARYQSPSPQAILTLGGGHQREVFTAEFARSHPNLPIWVSSGTNEVRAREIFESAGVDNHRFHLDYRATDTVTNFTTVVADFKQQNINHIYLITSDFHLPRAKAIAFVILGSQGITYTPVSLATNRPSEPKFKIVRDFGRAFLWVFIKRTGSSLNF
ncbi:YdcF family protein [Pleurocapsa sp. PCC 7319]|uniref:YdcF family protein n=1 Tax=Pleurocapsa sp. PCC 7319 TaxID=118161 RepID=UPI000375BD8C|nr:YdcF family protein [Pleurocapsa sp. PCC 7319]